MHDTDKLHGYWEGGIFRQHGSIGYDPLELNKFCCRQNGNNNSRVVGCSSLKKQNKHNSLVLFLGRWVGGEILNITEYAT